jgi:hypothetical protein
VVVGLPAAGTEVRAAEARTQARVRLAVKRLHYVGYVSSIGSNCVGLIMCCMLTRCQLMTRPVTVANLRLCTFDNRASHTSCRGAGGFATIGQGFGGNTGCEGGLEANFCGEKQRVRIGICLNYFNWCMMHRSQSSVEPLALIDFRLGPTASLILFQEAVVAVRAGLAALGSVARHAMVAMAAWASRSGEIREFMYLPSRGWPGFVSRGKNKKKKEEDV